MTVFQSLILGIIQGIAEFLPISSSGHLALMGFFLGVKSPPLIFDLLLHFATMIAAVIFFWKLIVRLSIRQVSIIILANIPVGLVGMLFNDQIESWFSSLEIVSAALIFTGVLNILSDVLLKKHTDSSVQVNPTEDSRQESKLKFKNFPNLKQALLVGVFQMISLTPGVSRSGSTVFAGLLSGLNRESAVAFSFLLVMPAIFGATLLELGRSSKIDLTELIQNFPVYLVGMAAAFCFGLTSLWLLKKILVSSKWQYFGIYCLVMGGSLIAGQLLGLI
jgi:undecaprenyl-diphosphatase